NLDHAPYKPGQVIEFRINDTDFRHYTPAFYDQEEGICEVWFYLHGLGPGSSWVAALQVGDQVNLLGPGGKMHFKTDYPLHIAFGDESALGLCNALYQTASSYQQAFHCLLELAPDHQAWPELVSLPAEVVASSVEQPAAGALAYVKGIEGSDWEPWQSAIYYLAGRAKSIQHLRTALRARGISNRQIISFPYWADGKKGL
ncbi:MAG: siderophore-interacting protein, partial [Bacteroidota bacterium]